MQDNFATRILKKHGTISFYASGTRNKAIETRIDSLNRMGISLSGESEDLELTATRPIAGSAFGLMLAKFDSLEKLLADGITCEKTYDPSSAGSTLSALAMANTIIHNFDSIKKNVKSLLKQRFPILAKYLEDKHPLESKLFGCFDAGYTALADAMDDKMGTKETAVRYKAKSSVNGLTASSESEESQNHLLDAASKEGGKTFSGMIVCPHNIMEIARVMVFIANIETFGADAKFPESAGAASLGAWLHTKILEGEISGGTVACFLRENGVDFDKLKNILGCDKDFDYVTAEAETHGGAMQKFHEQFVRGMESTKINTALHRNLRAEDSNALVFLSTGSNGTEKQRAYAEELNETISTNIAAEEAVEFKQL